MEEIEQKNPYSTASHNNELDTIFTQESDDIGDIVFESRDLSHDLKMYFRLFRKKISTLMREKMQKNFTNIIYLTVDCPPYTSKSSREDSPIEYITELRKQYPDNDIRVIIPIINLDDEFRPSKKLSVEIEGKSRVLEKTSISFDFFLQNRIQTAVVYKFPKTKANVQVYGIYSPIYSRVKNVSDMSKLHYLAPFLKAARIVVKNFSKEKFVPDIVHCENIPYYLGGEFESKLPPRVKVLQTIKDFTQIDIAKSEAFWAAINLADKSAMKKICRDSVVKKCVAHLFNLHNTQRFYQMKECLMFIYKNYYKFRKLEEEIEELEGLISGTRSRKCVAIIPRF